MMKIRLIFLCFIFTQFCSSMRPLNSSEMELVIGQPFQLYHVNDVEYQEYAKRKKYYKDIYLAMEINKTFECVVPGYALLSEAELQRGVDIPDDKIIGKGVFSFEGTKLFLKCANCSIPTAFKELVCLAFYDNPHGIGAGYRLDCFNKRNDKLVFYAWTK